MQFSSDASYFLAINPNIVLSTVVLIVTLISKTKFHNRMFYTLYGLTL